MYQKHLAVGLPSDHLRQLTGKVPPMLLMRWRRWDYTYFNQC